MNKPTWFPLWHNHPEKNDPGWFYFLNIYLFEGRVTETEEETDRHRDIFCVLLHSPNGHNSQV